MLRAATFLTGALLCVGSAAAQTVLPVEEVIADTYIAAFPDTGARIAVFDAGLGFREELFERDAAGVFDLLMPGQPPLTAAQIIVARVEDWPQAAAVYQETPLQDLSEAVSALPEDQPVYIEQVTMFDRIPVLTFTFLNEADGEVVHARCMARLVIDTLYTGDVTEFDLAMCSQTLTEAQ